MSKIRIPLSSMERYGFKAVESALKNDWRYGQAFFNELVNVRPELAERIRGTELDPFYISNPFDMIEFCKFIKSNWYETAEIEEG